MQYHSRAPLRIGLAGGGTDVSPYCDEFGGAVLNVTIGHFAYASIEPLCGRAVEFISCDQGEEVSYASDAPIEFDGHLDLLKYIHAFAEEKFNGGKKLSARVMTRIDVPAGSGLGGSSTLVVAVLKAYARWLQQPINDYDLAHSAYVIERERAGLAGGRQDQYAAAFGGFNFMEFSMGGKVLVNPLRVRQDVMSELESSMLLFYTGEARASASIITEQSKKVEKGDQAAIDATHQIRLEAFRMKEALLRGDFPMLYNVLQDSWVSKKKMATQIVTSDIERLYQAGLENGAYCARISGAGGGGFMVFLTHPLLRDNVSRSLLRIQPLGKVFSCHFSHSGAHSWEAREVLTLLRSTNVHANIAR